MTKTNDASPLILNILYMSGLKISPRKDAKPQLINRLDTTKKGNNDGKIFSCHNFREKLTDFMT
jgi:hypothetical protein